MFVDLDLAKKMFRFLIFIVYIAIDVTNVGLDLARKWGVNEVKTPKNTPTAAAAVAIESESAGANQGGQSSMQMVSQIGFCLRLGAICDGICLLLPTITLCHTEYTLILSTTKLSCDKITQHYQRVLAVFLNICPKNHIPILVSEALWE